MNTTLVCSLTSPITLFPHSLPVPFMVTSDFSYGPLPKKSRVRDIFAKSTNTKFLTFHTFFPLFSVAASLCGRNWPPLLLAGHVSRMDTMIIAPPPPPQSSVIGGGIRRSLCSPHNVTYWPSPLGRASRKTMGSSETISPVTSPLEDGRTASGEEER